MNIVEQVLAAAAIELKRRLIADEFPNERRVLAAAVFVVADAADMLTPDEMARWYADRCKF